MDELIIEERQRELLAVEISSALDWLKNEEELESRIKSGAADFNTVDWLNEHLSTLSKETPELINFWEELKEECQDILLRPRPLATDGEQSAAVQKKWESLVEERYPIFVKLWVKYQEIRAPLHDAKTIQITEKILSPKDLSEMKQVALQFAARPDLTPQSYGSNGTADYTKSFLYIWEGVSYPCKLRVTIRMQQAATINFSLQTSSDYPQHSISGFGLSPAGKVKLPDREATNEERFSLQLFNEAQEVMRKYFIMIEKIKELRGEKSDNDEFGTLIVNETPFILRQLAEGKSVGELLKQNEDDPAFHFRMARVSSLMCELTNFLSEINAMDFAKQAAFDEEAINQMIVHDHPRFLTTIMRGIMAMYKDILKQGVSAPVTPAVATN